MWWFVLAACTGPEQFPAEPAPEEPAQAPSDLTAEPEVSAVAPDEAPACPHVFTEQHSNQYYGQLSAVPGDDGCEFDAVRTRASTMGLEWKKGERVIAWTLAPAACAPDATATAGGLALTADAEARDACPKKWEGTVALMSSGTLPAPQPL